MNIAEAKEHVKNTVRAYLAKDELGMPRMDPARQRPLFLLGAPGIGKTAIMAQIADELGIGLVSYSMTHHTRQSALGLPFIVHRDYEGGSFEVSEYTMSEIIASLYDYMEATGRTQGILFLDEINCVSETLYPSMLQFLQFKTFGRHKVPEGWIVACAGNPPAYNRSVHEFDIVTLDRLRRIDIEPDYDAWKAYALEVGTHPAVLSFLELRRACFYSVESTPSGKRFVSARGWTDLSDAMMLYESMDMPVDRSLIEQYVQDSDIADQFALYYDLFQKYRADYQVESILSGQADEEVRTRARNAAFDERLAVLSLMLDGLSTSMSAATEQEQLVVDMRAVLRGAKPSLLEGAAVADVLGVEISRRTADREKNLAAGTASLADARSSKRALDFLHRVIAECRTAGAQEGAGAWDVIARVYQQEVDALAAARDNATSQLDAAFAFVQDTFGDEREMLVLTTELTARKPCARFLSHFGNDAYAQHSERLMVDAKRQHLMQQIDSLDLEIADDGQ